MYRPPADSANKGQELNPKFSFFSSIATLKKRAQSYSALIENEEVINAAIVTAPGFAHIAASNEYDKKNKIIALMKNRGLRPVTPQEYTNELETMTDMSPSPILWRPIRQREILQENRQSITALTLSVSDDSSDDGGQCDSAEGKSHAINDSGDCATTDQCDSSERCASTSEIVLSDCSTAEWPTTSYYSKRK